MLLWSWLGLDDGCNSNELRGPSNLWVGLERWKRGAEPVIKNNERWKRGAEPVIKNNERWKRCFCDSWDPRLRRWTCDHEKWKVKARYWTCDHEQWKLKAMLQWLVRFMALVLNLWSRTMKDENDASVTPEIHGFGAEPVIRNNERWKRCFNDSWDSRLRCWTCDHEQWKMQATFP